MEIPEILEAFRISDGIYKREHVDAAVELKEEITPHLIGILERVLSDPSVYAEDENCFDHIYAVMLLGHFKEHRAHETIVELFSLPDRIPSELFGDIVTEDLPVILLRTCHGSLEKIRSLALNRDAYDFCRSAAFQAMVYAVVDGIASRMEVLDFFGSLFTGAEAETDSDFWSFLANCVCDLYPEELMPVIEKAYQDGLIESFIIGYEDFERTLQGGKEETLEKTRQDFQRYVHADVHDHMSWWACFRSDQESVSIPVFSTDRSKKKLKKKKSKKKMAEASRKRNRKKRR